VRSRASRCASSTRRMRRTTPRAATRATTWGPRSDRPAPRRVRQLRRAEMADDRTVRHDEEGLGDECAEGRDGQHDDLSIVLSPDDPGGHGSLRHEYKSIHPQVMDVRPFCPLPLGSLRTLSCTISGHRERRNRAPGRAGVCDRRVHVGGPLDRAPLNPCRLGVHEYSQTAHRVPALRPGQPTAPFRRSPSSRRTSSPSSRSSTSTVTTTRTTS
jgi:hypothetical protein